MNNRPLKKVAITVLATLITMPALLMALNAKPKAPACFFVQTAKQARLTSDQLILLSPNKNTTWFANAPSKDTGVMTTKYYYNLLWGAPTSHFNKDHPNASLVGEVMNPKTHHLQTVDIIVRLDRAQLHDHQIIYRVHTLLKQSNLLDLQKTLVLMHPTLFIDRYICPTCD
jgi:hypothetical protein